MRRRRLKRRENGEACHPNSLSPGKPQLSFSSANPYRRTGIERRRKNGRPTRGKVRRGESEEPRGVERREVDAAVTSRAPETVVPERRMEADGFVEKLNGWHVL